MKNVSFVIKERVVDDHLDRSMEVDKLFIMPIAADINSYAKNLSIPATEATVRSCVFCYPLATIVSTRKNPAHFFSICSEMRFRNEVIYGLD